MSRPQPTFGHRPRARTRRIILQATHTHPGAPGLKSLVTHMGRAGGLLGCGFHYVVDIDGNPWACRPDNLQGSHTPGFNRESIGVLLDGGLRPDGEPGDTFTPDQMDGLVVLLKDLRRRYGDLDVKARTELGRNKLRPTPCPPIDMPLIRRRTYQE